MVRPRGFEPLTFCSGGKRQRTISNLAPVASIPRSCALLLVIKDFGDCCAVALATARNPSMQGVGTIMGTLKLCNQTTPNLGRLQFTYCYSQRHRPARNFHPLR